MCVALYLSAFVMMRLQQRGKGGGDPFVCLLVCVFMCVDWYNKLCERIGFCVMVYISFFFMCQHLCVYTCTLYLHFYLLIYICVCAYMFVFLCFFGVSAYMFCCASIFVGIFHLCFCMYVYSFDFWCS